MKKEEPKFKIKDKKRFDLGFLTNELNVREDKEFFFENLAQMLASGIDLVVTLDALILEARNRKMSQTILEIRDEIENGTPLWKSLAKRDFLPDYLLSLVRTGEESGNLARNLGIVIEQQNKEREFRSKLRSASLYPIIVLVLLLLVGSGVALFILPRLASVYLSLKVPLPFITQVIIGIGQFLEVYGFIAIPIFLVTILGGIYLVFYNKRTKGIGQRILFNIKVTRLIVQETELARMGFMIGSLVKSGFKVNDAFKLLGESTTFYAYRRFYNNVSEWILEGLSFKQIFARMGKKSNKIIPVFPRQMIISGEQSGGLAESFLKIGDMYEKRNEETSKNIGTIIEPLLLIVIWLGVAVLALAVILPVYSLIGDITNLSSGQVTTTQ